MMEPTKSKTVQLTFENGTPHGIVNVKSLTSPYNIMAAPRNSLSQLPGEKTYQKPGNYLLKGETEEDLTLYVGQSDDVLKRIKQHYQKKEWWTHCCLLTSKGDELNISHTRYLERCLYDLAQDNGYVKLDNEKAPDSSPLSQEQKNEAEHFLQDALLVFPSLGFNFFYDSAGRPQAASPAIAKDKKESSDSTPAAKDVSIPIFKIKQGKITATVQLQDDKWVVLKDSLGRLEFTPSWKTHSLGYYKQRERLKENGILQKQGETLIFTQDTPFTSPSAAASIVLASTMNGYKTWRVPEENKPYSQWQTYGEWEKIYLEATSDASLPVSKSERDPSYDGASAAKDASLPIFKVKIGKANASARLQGDKWVVLKGSLGRLEFTPSLKTHFLGYYKQRERLKENGILQEQEDTLIFTQDTPFTSSSAAASIVLARPLNGYKTWKVPEKDKPYSQWQTYGEWEATQLEAAAS